MHTEHLTASGHSHVLAQHSSTLEVTTDEWLTPAGDCIVGIKATKAPADFSPSFIAACQDEQATITLTLTVGTFEDHLIGRGDPTLTFRDERSLVARTSDYIDDRTVMLEATGSAGNIDRALIDALTDGVELAVTLSVEH